MTGGGPDEGGLPSIEDLAGPVRDPVAAAAVMRYQLGIGPVPQRPADRLDVSDLAGLLGGDGQL